MNFSRLNEKFQRKIVQRILGVRIADLCNAKVVSPLRLGNLEAALDSYFANFSNRYGALGTVCLTSLFLAERAKCNRRSLSRTSV